MINKIAKAKRYAEEPERIQFTRFEATFRGENDVHTTNYDNGEWNCTCRFFHDWGDCSHTMAMQRVLGVTIPAAYRHGIPAGLGAVAVAATYFVPSFSISEVIAVAVDVATPLLACSGLLSTSISFSVEL